MQGSFRNTIRLYTYFYRASLYTNAVSPVCAMARSLHRLSDYHFTCHKSVLYHKRQATNGQKYIGEIISRNANALDKYT